MTTLAKDVSIEKAMKIMDKHDAMCHRGWRTARWQGQGFVSDKGELIYDVVCPECDPEQEIPND